MAGTAGEAANGLACCSIRKLLQSVGVLQRSSRLAVRCKHCDVVARAGRHGLIIASETCSHSVRDVMFTKLGRAHLQRDKCKMALPRELFHRGPALIADFYMQAGSLMQPHGVKGIHLTGSGIATAGIGILGKPQR
jgi:hypothetical protein